MSGGLVRFLQRLKAAPPRSDVVYVIGNESADMDSCCSALLGAFLYSQAAAAAPGEIAGETAGETAGGAAGGAAGGPASAADIPDVEPRAVPVINIPRSEFRLRGDIQYLFEHLQIPEPLLWFRDDVRFGLDSRLFLVDHNAQTVVGRVAAVIDHHEPEGPAPGPSVAPHVLQRAGSCASLVIDYFRPRVPAAVWADRAVPTLGTAPLLLDTKNMQHKVEPVDVSSFAFLRDHGAFGGQPDAFYAQLKDRKRDISTFSAHDVLRKDYKRWGKLGISSLPVLFAKARGQFSDFAAQIAQYRAAEGLDVYIALASGTVKGTYVRQFAAVVAEGSALPDLAAALPALQLELETAENGVAFYNQRAVTATRKQVAPLVRALLQEHAAAQAL